VGLNGGMLSGFNTNFRYRGVLFHVQTEDSGVSNPRVFTHLFKGGDILASMKSDYSDQLESPNLESEVRSLMEGQHKSMLRALSRGEHDAAITARLGARVFTDEGGDTDATIPPPEVLEPVEPVAAAKGSESPKERIARAFGDGVESQKPLDEVVLDYLVDNARKRKRSSK
jgi:hypothetical protein